MLRTVARGDLKSVLSLWSLPGTSSLSYIPWGNTKTPYCEWIGLGIQQYGSTISLSLWGEFSLSGAVWWTFIGPLFINPALEKRTTVGGFRETARWVGSAEVCDLLTSSGDVMISSAQHRSWETRERFHAPKQCHVHISHSGGCMDETGTLTVWIWRNQSWRHWRDGNNALSALRRTERGIPRSPSSSDERTYSWRSDNNI